MVCIKGHGLGKYKQGQGQEDMEGAIEVLHLTF